MIFHELQFHYSGTKLLNVPMAFSIHWKEMWPINYHRYSFLSLLPESVSIYKLHRVFKILFDNWINVTFLGAYVILYYKKWMYISYLSCDECEYISIQRSMLVVHTDKTHKIIIMDQDLYFTRIVWSRGGHNALNSKFQYVGC